MLKEMVPLLNEDTVLKFRARRPLKSAAETENKAVFYLEISLRSSIANRLYELMRKMASSACWQIIGTQIRKDTQRRSNAVQQLHNIAYVPLTPLQVSIIRQKLVNTSNTCYINASVMLGLWRAAAWDRTDLPQTWLSIIEKQTWYPVTFLRFALLGWRHLHQQHDAGEFLGHLLPKLPWASPEAIWSSRVQNLVHYERSCS